MDSVNAIEVNDIKKSFKVFFDKSNLLKERVLFWKRNRFERRNVLGGISFNVKKGEAVGLIGHNGCGKSTTLKLLTKIMYPDSGTIEMRGRVSALIELGAGFHPDMSGRENIYTNAAIFGLTKKEIDSKVADIFAFSELEEFIDNPVRTYSSGMYMRLAFAVAINVDADILLIDEILAVGDAAFQAKCFNRLKEIKASGTTIVIVSHSLGQIEQICERSIWIDEGQIRTIGAPKTVHGEYLEQMGVRTEEDKKKAIESFKKLPAARAVFDNRYWSECDGGHSLRERTASLIVEAEKDRPLSVSLHILVKVPDAALRINVEGSEPFDSKRLLPGEKVYAFTLSKNTLHAGSRLHIDFETDDLLLGGNLVVKGVGVEYE